MDSPDAAAFAFAADAAITTPVLPPVVAAYRSVWPSASVYASVVF